MERTDTPPVTQEKEQQARHHLYESILGQNGGGTGARQEPGESETSADPQTVTNGKPAPDEVMEQRSPREDDSSSGNRDEEDEPDDDEDAEERDDAKFDPERLKAFNMFVRLFVDENLDRMIPISKQPKEKIQAIIDSCSRQFPEFVDRARKRLRTYLKSCRRNKRSRELAGLEGAAARASRPTPPHLTSVQAEQILAQACENESQNAKRMRLGLEPISQPLTQPTSSPQLTTTAGGGGGDRGPCDSASRSSSGPERGSRPLPAAAAAALPTDRPAVCTPQEQLPVPAAGLFQPSFSQAFGQMFPGMLGAPGFQLPPNGKVPDLLSRKPLPAPPRAQLSPAEVAAVRQLVNGYRESANFLRRSADELELLIQQSGH